MVAPIVAALPMIGRTVMVMLSRWQVAVAFTGLIVTTTFSLNVFVDQLTSSALRLWPILSIACLFMLAREFIRGWLTIKAKEAPTKEIK